MQQSDTSSSEELSASGKEPKEPGGRRVLGHVLTAPLLPPPGSGGSWVRNVTEKAKSLLAQREASTLNTLLFVYLIL